VIAMGGRDKSRMRVGDAQGFGRRAGK